MFIIKRLNNFIEYLFKKKQKINKKINKKRRIRQNVIFYVSPNYKRQ